MSPVNNVNRCTSEQEMFTQSLVSLFLLIIYTPQIQVNAHWTLIELLLYISTVFNSISQILSSILQI